MTRFNRQRTKAEARAEIQAELPGLTAGGATSPLSTDGRWATPPSRTSPWAVPALPWITNHQGGTGYVREPKSELFLLAVANLVGQRSFYESADSRDERYTRLVRQLAVSAPCVDPRPARLAAHRGPDADGVTGGRGRIRPCPAGCRSAGILPAGHRRRAPTPGRAG